MADLEGWGRHCKICNQVDYLPFQCSSCQGVFCAEHRKREEHSCPAAALDQQGGLIVCPLCAKGIKVQPNQDANVAFQAHSASPECDPANYNKVHNKQRCPVQVGEARCKEKLTEINTYRCKHCGTRVCLKHRLPDDHQCQQLQAEARKLAAEQAKRDSVFGKFQNLLQPKAAAPAGRPSSASQNRPSSSNQNRPAAAARNAGRGGRGSSSSRAPQDPANTVIGSAQRRMQQQQAASTSQPEVCPHANCGARFASVEQLILHVESQHSRQGSTQQQQQEHQQQRRQGSGRVMTGLNCEMYRCPKCNHAFMDPTQLISHAENCHRQGDSGAGGDKKKRRRNEAGGQAAQQPSSTGGADDPIVVSSDSSEEEETQPQQKRSRRPAPRQQPARQRRRPAAAQQRQTVANRSGCNR